MPGGLFPKEDAAGLERRDGIEIDLHAAPFDLFPQDMGVKKKGLGHEHAEAAKGGNEGHLPYALAQGQVKLGPVKE